jgi:hypothetical protein
MPSTSAEPSSSPWGQARPVGAGEADGGKRGWWGQARLVGAGEANGGRKPPGQIRSQHIIDLFCAKGCEILLTIGGPKGVAGRGDRKGVV